VQVKELDAEVKQARSSVAKQRENLLALHRKIKDGTEQVTWNEEPMSLAEAKLRLHREVETLKLAAQKLESREELLKAQGEQLQATHEQLTGILKQKEEFTVRLAQLEATGDPLQLDKGRVAEVKKLLDSIERSQKVETAQRDLERQYRGVNEPRPRPTATNVDLNAIEAYLNGTARPQPTVARE
jgi:hypothetical protein